jgi:hypothetical protein
VNALPFGPPGELRELRALAIRRSLDTPHDDVWRIAAPRRQTLGMANASEGFCGSRKRCSAWSIDTLNIDTLEH